MVGLKANVFEDVHLRGHRKEDIEANGNEQNEHEVKVENETLAFSLIERTKALQAPFRLVFLLHVSLGRYLVTIVFSHRLKATEQTHQRVLCHITERLATV